MNRYVVAVQNVNCGEVKEAFTETIEEANTLYDIAVSCNAQFAEIFDMEEDMQVRWHLAESTHLVF